eukprot:scaffold32685_cov33-Tisochrysis_lutea.AAC.1
MDNKASLGSATPTRRQPLHSSSWDRGSGSGLCGAADVMWSELAPWAAPHEEKLIEPRLDPPVKGAQIDHRPANSAAYRPRAVGQSSRTAQRRAPEEGRARRGRRAATSYATPAAAHVQSRFHPAASHHTTGLRARGHGRRGGLTAMSASGSGSTARPSSAQPC